MPSREAKGMRRLLISLLIVALAAMCVAGGVFAFFSDEETSPGNVLQAGTSDLSLDVTTVTVKLHPRWVGDSTCICYLKLGKYFSWYWSGAEVASSDDQRITTKGKWEASYADCDVLEFAFPPIPDGATVTDATIDLEWARQANITEARLRVFDGTGAYPYPYRDYTLTLPPPPTDEWGADGSESIDISDFIDSADKVNNIVVWFQAIGNDRTRHDLVELEVTYTVNSAPLIVLEGLEPAEPQCAIITVTNEGSTGGTLTLHFKDLMGESVEDKGCMEMLYESPIGPYVNNPDDGIDDPDDPILVDDIDNPQTFIWVTIWYDGNFVTEGYFADIASSDHELGSLAGGGSGTIEISFNLDPNGETGNVYRDDCCTFDIELLMEQE